MIRIPYLFGLIFLIISCNHRTLEPNEKKGLYGKIKNYDEIFLVKKDIEKNESFFDTIQKIKYDFNEKKKVKKKNVWAKLNKKILIKTSTYEFDNNDRILKEVTVSSIKGERDSTTREHYYTYNENNQLSEIKSSNENEKVISNENYKYYYDNTNQLIKTEYNYIRIILDKKDTITTKVLRFYNIKGLLKNEKYIYTNINNEKENYIISYKYKYNRRNLKSKISKSNNEGDEKFEQTFKYDFDKNESWILQKGYKENELVSKTIRLIEYH